MKTSNKLLLALFALIFLSAMGANLPLKQTFDILDRNDPYSGYLRDTLPAFKYIKLTGNSFTVVQIQPGTRFEMRNIHFERSAEEVTMKTEVRGDTLFVVLEKNADSEVRFWGENPMMQKPSVYIMATTLSGISSEGLLTKITGWRGGVLSVAQIGKSLLLTDNQFDSLSLSAYLGSSIEIDANNAMGNATLLVRDSSRIDIQKDVFSTFRMQADSTAYVSLPGSMLRGKVGI